MNKQEIIERLSADEDRCKYCNSSTVSGGDIYCSAGHSHDMNCDGKDFKIDYKIEEVISALEQQLTNGWIPVSERLPEDIKGNGLVTVLACLKSKDDSLFFSDNTVYQEVTDYITDTQEWEIDNGYEVLAWRQLPEPYKELATDNNVVTKSGKDNNALTFGDKIRESN